MIRSKWLGGMILALALSGCQTGLSTGLSADEQKRVDSARLNVQLAMAYLDSGDMMAAKSKLNKAMKQAPKLPLVYYAWGFYNQRTGEYQEADEAFRRGIALAPKKGEGHNNYGTFLCQQARYQEAEQEFLLAIQDDEYLSTARSYENAGLCSLEARNESKAKGYFKQALDHDPRSLKSLIELAYLSYGDREFTMAEHLLSRYRQQEFDSARTLFLGIEISKALGKSDVAASQALLLKNKFPNSKEARQLQGLGEDE